MTSYRSRTERVEAVRLAAPLTVTAGKKTLAGDKGDWLVFRDGEPVDMLPDAEFRRRYEAEPSPEPHRPYVPIPVPCPTLPPWQPWRPFWNETRWSAGGTADNSHLLRGVSVCAAGAVDAVHLDNAGDTSH